MGFLDDMGKAITDVGQSTLQKGKEIADVAKYKSYISDENHIITSTYEKIGRRYVELYADHPEDSMVDMINKIHESEKKINDYQQILRELKGIAICTNCESEVPSSSQFCPVCGTKMEGVGLICSGCGAKLVEGTKFCTVCGKPVE